jgi:hypothetical protein
LENLASRPPVLQLGAGEVRNIKPYGYKRSEGLKRLEDHMRFYHAYRTTEEPIDLEGDAWTFNQAWLGRGGNAENLRLWGLGGGPRLLDITTSYADGIACVAPPAGTMSVFPSYDLEQEALIMRTLAERTVVPRPVGSVHGERQLDIGRPSS